MYIRTIKVITLFFVMVLSMNTNLLGADAKALLKQGIALGKAKNYQKAEKLFLKVLKEEPMNVKAHYFLAISQWKIDKEDEARKSYQAILLTNTGLAKNLEKMFPAISYPLPSENETALAEIPYRDLSRIGQESRQNSNENESFKIVGNEDGKGSVAGEEKLSERELIEKKVAEGWQKTESSIPSTVVDGFNQILIYEPENVRALEGLCDHYSEQKDGYRFRRTVRKMAKAGHISWDECDDQINEYNEENKK